MTRYVGLLGNREVVSGSDREVRFPDVTSSGMEAADWQLGRLIT